MSEMNTVPGSAFNAKRISERLAMFSRLLLRDPVAFAAACCLLVAVIAALIGPIFLGDAATRMSLAARNAPPDLSGGWLGALGTDALGRSVLARVIVAARPTLAIAVFAAVGAMFVGGALGLAAGFMGGRLGRAIMQLSDVIQSFPSTLFAIVVLYISGPSILNLILVLALTRTPEYIRLVRSETLEIRERLFIDAARAMGGKSLYIMATHVVPVVSPTVLNVLSVDIAFAMLSESGLSFLGIGMQPPDITWGLMVAGGRNYVATAWWVSFFPGLAIMLFALSVNIVYRWLRRVTDPRQAWKYGQNK